MNSAAAAIATTGLAKRFHGGQFAVADLDLDVPVGSVFGFLGPNGSGKTTTIRMLLGLVRPTAGSVRLFDQPMPARAAAVLPRVGALIEGPALYPWLSGRANLRRLDAAGRVTDPMTRTERIEHALERAGLSAAAGKRYKAYSLGMRQRLCIAAALLSPRDLLVLDEPTNGLDPQGTREIRTLVRTLSAEGTTVFLSSHLLTEIEQVCTHAAVMRAGRLVSQGRIEQLRAAARPLLNVETSEPDRASAELARLGATGVSATGPAVRAELGTLVPEDVCAALVHAGVPVLGFGIRHASLEDTFVALTGEGFDVAE